MEIGILGPLRVVVPGAVPRQVSAPKVRSILANLLVTPNQVVAVDQLVKELWGSDPPRTARTALQVHVSALRKLLVGTGLSPVGARVETRQPGYAIMLDPRLLDSVRFDGARTCAAATQETGDLQSASEEFARALRIWRGPALADARDTPRLRATARRLEETRMATFERRVQIDLHLGRSGELIGELYSAVAEHPLHEKLHEHLMTALYDQRRPNDALDVYANYRSFIRDAVGLEPGRRLRELQRVALQWGCFEPDPRGSQPSRTAAPVTDRRCGVPS